MCYKEGKLMHIDSGKRQKSMGGYGSGRKTSAMMVGSCTPLDVQLTGELPGVLLDYTYPHYGGARAWYRAPCCLRRTRFLYRSLNMGGLACRVCLGLQYDEPIEKAKTYERYLLTHPSLMSRALYDCLPEHYLSEEEYDQALRIGYQVVIVRQLRFTIQLLRILIQCSPKVEDREEARASIIDLCAALKERGLEDEAA